MSESPPEPPEPPVLSQPTEAAADAAPRSSLPYALPTTPTGTAVDPGGGVSRHDAAVLALRIVGIYALFQLVPVLGYLPSVIYYRNDFIRGWDTEELAPVLLTLSPALVWAVLGIYLLTRAERLAPKLLPGAGGGAGLGAPARDLFAVALAVVGVLLVSRAVTPLIQWVHAEVRSGAPADLDRSYAVSAPDLLPTLVQIALGVGLFLGSKGLAVYWHRLRNPQSGQTHAEADVRAQDPGGH